MMKHFFFSLFKIITACWLLIMLGNCSSKKQGDSVATSDSIPIIESEKPALIKGRWEMPLRNDPSLRGQMEDVKNITYSMELDFSGRTFLPELTLPSGQNSYGWMDFSNVSRIYHYDIDSVAYLGHNAYRVVSMDSWEQLNIDTLIYNPEMKTIYIKNQDFTFPYKPDDKPVHGKWQSHFEEEPGISRTYTVILSLYKQITCNESFMEGVNCYGYSLYDDEGSGSCDVIDSIISIHHDYAEVQFQSGACPNCPPVKCNIVFNRDDGSITINDNGRIPRKE